MTKKDIIWISVMLALLVLIGVLFGAVFCLRKQDVKIVGEGELSVTEEAIIETAGFKKGSSIFLLDKEKAVENIELAYEEIKVVQIKTVSLTKIEIIVRKRHKMFYSKVEEQYFILDEELKVLETSANAPVGLIELTNLDNISLTTQKSEFVGSTAQQQATENLYVGMMKTVSKGGVEPDLTRDDMKSLIKSVKFEQEKTFNKIIVTTSYGVKLDIENPQENMTNKVNLCFSAIAEFIADEDEKDKEKSGTIKIYYDLENEQKCVYIPDALPLPPAE